MGLLLKDMGLLKLGTSASWSTWASLSPPALLSLFLFLIIHHSLCTVKTLCVPKDYL